MQTSKKELIIGAVVVVLVAQSLIGGITTIMKYSQPVIADDNVASIFAWILTAMTVGYTVLGAVLILKAPKSVENLSKKYTIKATIPGYFLFALLPYAYGLALIELTRLSTWGFYLACASIPAVLLFLVLLLRRKDSN
jgi:uncharacterized membrane protein YdcZ (DUF606 family)